MRVPDHDNDVACETDICKRLKKKPPESKALETTVLLNYLPVLVGKIKV